MVGELLGNLDSSVLSSILIYDFFSFVIQRGTKIALDFFAGCDNTVQELSYLTHIKIVRNFKSIKPF